MLEAGDQLGGFRITELLGVGGMGEVYLATDSTLDDRPVAVKLVSQGAQPDADASATLLREAKTVANLNHPNICTVHRIGESEGQLYIVMEHVEGQSLRDVLNESGPLDVDSVVRIGAKVAAALHHAHERGVVHRDLKPDNIMLTEDGEPKVLDFGLAARQVARNRDDLDSATDPISEMRGGTMHYMAPETLRGDKADFRVDVWALGVTLYELATGRKPFDARNAADLTINIISEPPAPLPEHQDPGFRAVVSRCLRKSPRERYQRANEVQVALETIELGRTFPSHPALLERATSRLRLRKLGLALTGVVLAAAAVFGLISLWPEPEPITVAVLPFSGDSMDQQQLGRVVADSLIVRLQQIPGLDVAPWHDVRELTVDPNDAEALAEACRVLGVRWLVHGAVNTASDGVVLDWVVATVEGGVEQIGSESARRDYLGPALTKVSESVRSLLPLSDSARTAPIDPLRTADFEALELYSQARDRADQWDNSAYLAESIELFQAAVDIDPTFAASYAGLASANVTRYVQTNDNDALDAARESVARATNLGPRLPESRVAEGLFHIVTGDSIAAARALEQALELAPGNDAALRQIAKLYVTLDRHDEADSAYLRAIGLRDYWANHYDYARFLIQHRGATESARPHLLRALELNPGGTNAVIFLSANHLARGELDLAEELALQVVEEGPSTPAYTILGFTAYARADWALALQHFSAALESSPQTADTQANVGDALRQLGEVEQAAEHYETALATFDRQLAADQGDDERRSQRALVLAATGDCESAARDITVVIEDNPTSDLFRYYATVVAGRCQNYDQAEEMALQLVADNQFVFALRTDPDLTPVFERPALIEALPDID